MIAGIFADFVELTAADVGVTGESLDASALALVVDRRRVSVGSAGVGDAGIAAGLVGAAPLESGTVLVPHALRF